MTDTSLVGRSLVAFAGALGMFLLKDQTPAASQVFAVYVISRSFKFFMLFCYSMGRKDPRSQWPSVGPQPPHEHRFGQRKTKRREGADLWVARRARLPRRCGPTR